MSQAATKIELMFASIIEQAAESVRAISPEGSPRRSPVDALAALGRLRGALDATEVRLTAAVDSLGDHGAGSATVLRSVTHCSDREAKKRERRARSLSEMPRIAAALASGSLPTETVDALVRAADMTDPRVVDCDQRLLADLTTRPADLGARHIRDWTRSHQCVLDREQRLERQREARSANWFTGDDEMLVVHASFDPVTGSGLRSILDAEVELLWRADGGRDGRPNDIRNPTQRRADALARVLGVGGPRADSDPAVEPAATTTTVVVVADIGVIDGTDPEGRCEILDTGPVPPSILAHLSPNTLWRGALFDGAARPLWLGRGRRLASQDLRLMVAVRDRHCVLCGAPVSRCDAHHVTPWSEGGSTDPDNIILVCTPCHTLIHQGQVQLIRLDDGSWQARPSINAPGLTAIEQRGSPWPDRGCHRLVGAAPTGESQSKRSPPIARQP